MLFKYFCIIFIVFSSQIYAAAPSAIDATMLDIDDSECFEFFNQQENTPINFNGFKVGFSIINNCSETKVVDDVTVSFHNTSTSDFIETCYRQNSSISIPAGATHLTTLQGCNKEEPIIRNGRYKLVYRAKYAGSFRDVLSKEITLGISISPVVSLLLDDEDEEEQPDITSGLVAHYEFEGNADDSSGNGNHGTEFGGVAYSIGVKGQAADFDGVNDYLEIPSSILTGSQFTISAWIHPEKNNAGILSAIEQGATSIENEFLIYIENSGDVNLYYESKNGVNGEIIPTNINVIGMGDFLYTQVVDTNSTKIYIDGVLVETIAHGPHTFSPSALFVGGDADCIAGCISSDQFYEGPMDELRIYGRTLSSNEIEGLYTFFTTP